MANGFLSRTAPSGSLRAFLGAPTSADVQATGQREKIRIAALQAALENLPIDAPNRPELEASLGQLTGDPTIGMAFRPAPQEPVKLGAQQRLVDPTTGETLIPTLPGSGGAGPQPTPAIQVAQRIGRLRAAADRGQLPEEQQFELEILERGKTEGDRLETEILDLREKSRTRGLTEREQDQLNLKERRLTSRINVLNALLAGQLGFTGAAVAPAQPGLPAPTGGTPLTETQRTVIDEARRSLARPDATEAGKRDVLDTLRTEFGLTDEQLRAEGLL